MRALEFSRVVLSACVVVAMLSACGGGSSIPSPTDNPINNAATPKNSKTFKYTGSEQTFKVPKGVTQLTVVAHGGEGAGFSVYPSTAAPGRPGRVYAIIAVHPGDKLYVFVGGSGADGGFNGGGTGGSNTSRGGYAGNSGGGASDVRAGGTGILDRIIVAAGGGGAGQAILTYATDYGGDGGGLIGKPGGGGGSGIGGGAGQGGTQSAGGAGGAGGSTYSGCLRGQSGGGGDLGFGGNGGNGGGNNAGGGGGGGGGYYGGGGGGGAGANYYCSFPVQGGGGGGGSSYVEPSAIKSRMWTGWKSKGDGLVVFSWN